MDQGPRLRSGPGYFPRAPIRRAAEVAGLWPAAPPVRACFPEQKGLAPGSWLGLPEPPNSDPKGEELLSCDTQQKQELSCTSKRTSFSQSFFQRALLPGGIVGFQ